VGLVDVQRSREAAGFEESPQVLHKPRRIQIISGGTIKKKIKATKAIPRAFFRAFFLSTKCLAYSEYVMTNAMAAAKGEKTRAITKTNFNTTVRSVDG
jgi:hypothetical protein